ncbi:MAG: T9SS type A sorting domain-containing protein [Bacteroidota bacterium]
MTPIQVQVMDITGDVLWKTSLPAGSQEYPIDLSDLQNGLYLLELNADGLVQRTQVSVRK